MTQKQQSRKSKRGGGIFDSLFGKKDAVAQLTTELDNAEKKVAQLKIDLENAKKQSNASVPVVDIPVESGPAIQNPAPQLPPMQLPAVGGKTKKRRKTRK